MTPEREARWTTRLKLQTYQALALFWVKHAPIGDTQRRSTPAQVQVTSRVISAIQCAPARLHQVTVEGRFPQGAVHSIVNLADPLLKLPGTSSLGRIAPAHRHGS